MANAKGRSLRLTHVQALRFHFAPRSKLICMMRQLTLSASLLALLCFFFLPDVTMQTCVSTEESLRDRCSSSLQLWNTTGIALSLSGEPFADQIRSFSDAMRPLACNAAVHFRSCIRNLIFLCPPTSPMDVESLVAVASYVDSPSYRQQCLETALCGPNEFACFVNGASGCRDLSLACDKMSHCDDELDESAYACGCGLDNSCFQSLTTNNENVPFISLQQNITSQVLQLNEYGAEVVCRALKDATSCDKEKNQTCQSPIWQGNVNAATFVESAFYRTFCVLKQRNLKTCDFQDVSRCLAYLEDTSDKSLSAQLSSLNQRGKELRNVCTAYSNFTSCFDEIKDRCMYSDNQFVKLAFKWANETNQDAYKFYCRHVSRCKSQDISYCLPILTSESRQTVRLGIDSEFSSQIQALTGERQNTACNLVVTFKLCIDYFKNCSDQHPELETMSLRLQSYVRSDNYRKQCLENDTCTSDHIPCRVAWLGLKCIPKYFVCDGARDCDDGEDEKSCPGSNNASCKPAEVSAFSLVLFIVLPMLSILHR
ncbi:vitellogenin receptor-like [Oscarella lobularis]|uniref:vitellogenin receptor-like n=1 Tax=Oscarella lobularis TaxID=121494 RepID=UPI003313162F